MNELLESCPWCQGSLESGIVEGDRWGLRWYEADTSTMKRLWVFTGESLGHAFTAERFRNCEKVILIERR